MGFYSQVIFPRMLDMAMSSPILADYRQQVLADVEGSVLEIGFGSGINLSYYPDHLAQLVTVDANAGINKLAQKRIAASSIQIDNRVLNGENLPMADHSFDCVVSTWTLCSIAHVEQALKEIHRVLKPGGRFYFVEHGLSDDPKVQVWQNRLNPLQNVIADGCNLNRDIYQLIADQFNTVTLKRFYMPKTPKFVGYLYQGVAVKE